MWSKINIYFKFITSGGREYRDIFRYDDSQCCHLKKNLLYVYLIRLRPHSKFLVIELLSTEMVLLMDVVEYGLEEDEAK